MQLTAGLSIYPVNNAPIPIKSSHAYGDILDRITALILR